jgi:hypothetical protein
MKISTVVAAAFLVSAGMTAPVYAQDKEKAKGTEEGRRRDDVLRDEHGKGNGADLGGLEGADAHCNALAKAAGSKITHWKAYLSTTAPAATRASTRATASARARGAMPRAWWWRKNVADLHSAKATSARRPR